MSSPSWYHWNNSSQSDDNCHWVITIFSHSCCHYHCHRNHHCHCQISCCSPVALGHQDYCQRKNKNKTVGYSHQFTLILLRTNWFSQEKKKERIFKHTGIQNETLFNVGIHIICTCKITCNAFQKCTFSSNNQ